MRSAVAQANQAVNQAGTSAAQYGGQANQIASTVVPFEEQMLMHPTGYTPQQQQQMEVAAAQGLGGATSGITGQANLAAARARNQGAQTMALDQAMRTRGQLQSQANLGIATQNAQLQQQQQAQAARALGGFMTADQEAALRAQGLGIQGIDAATQASRAGWFQNLTGMIGALTGGRGA